MLKFALYNFHLPNHMLRNSRTLLSDKDMYMRAKVREHRELMLIKPNFTWFDIVNFGDWRDPVIGWSRLWRDGTSSEFKKRQLYLWGDSDVGKTHFIQDFLLFGWHMRYDVFVPTSTNTKNSFKWQGFDEKQHSCVLIEEANLKQYCFSQFKQILEGKLNRIN